MSKAVEELIQKHKNIIGFVIKKWFPNLIGDDDIFQTGMIALWEAIEKYDESKNASLETFATSCIRNKILKELRKQNAAMRTARENMALISLDDKDNLVGETTSDNTANMENVIALKDYIDRQPDMDRQIIYLKAKGRTTSQIAVEMNLAKRTTERRWKKIKDDFMEMKNVL